MNPDSLPSEMLLVPRVPTEAMRDAAARFKRDLSYLSHPDVPYAGTANGDSPEAWERRVNAALYRAMLKAAPQGAQPANRSAKAYAIEHAGYMATTAQRLLEAINEEDRARMAHDERGGQLSGMALDRCMSLRGERIHALRNDIYEFDKRRVRAAAASPADAAPVPQARMLTEDEVAPILDDIVGNYPSDLAEQIQRRFAEVNGLTIPAKEQP